MRDHFLYSQGILQIGLSHVSAPVAIREEVAFSDTEACEILGLLSEVKGVSEIALLATCNRTEFYAVVSDLEAVCNELVAAVEEYKGLGSGSLGTALEVRKQDEAVRHLLRVAAGLESQIFGEGQILGQVRDAAARARELGVLGPILDSLFRNAIQAGKRVRTETPIAQGAVSVGSAAVELAREALDGLEGRAVLLIGTGKIGEITLRLLASYGVKRTLVVNRTFESAQALAHATGAEAIPFLGMEAALSEVDVVLCCTGAPHYVLRAGDLQSVLAQRAGTPLVLVDMSLPRNIDPAVAQLGGIRLFDLDALKGIADRNLAQRAALAEQAERILDEMMDRFGQWLCSYWAAPTIVGLRRKIDSLREAELERFLSRQGSVFTVEQRAAIEQLTRQLANKFLHDPMTGLKAQGPKREAHSVAICELFGLEDLMSLRRPSPLPNRVPLAKAHG